MKAIEQRKAAAKFAKDWAKKKGNEKKETQKFWNDLLENVYGVKGVRDFIFYEDDVKVGNATKWIDASIPTTKVFIEQKSKGIDLDKKIRQSGDIFLTPYEQAKRYADSRPNKKRPDWIVTCNFTEFHIHNLNSETPEQYEVVKLCELEEDFGRMKFLQDITDTNTYKEVQVSRQAGELIGEIYDKLLEQYGTNPTEHHLHQLNILCVRLVFCLYAEDADIFDNNAFLNYLSQYPADQLREKLLTLFDVLNTPRDKRSPFLDEKLQAFPWVNGGLFESGIDVPPITEEVRALLLDKASRQFNWRYISPTIFGAMFESTLNPETRHDGGMHYTSIENIHKVIDPLFLDDLRTELDGILKLSMEKTRKQRLAAFQQKLGGIRCLDPACGSGNFLTETYMSLRELENRAIAERYDGRLNAGLLNPIEVNISQFYGIEINDFAVAVAKTAMWIAEYQMWAKTMSLVARDDSEDDEDGFLPLKSYNNIHQGNALRTEWSDIVKPEGLSYIIGNPPFAGRAYQTPEQKKEIAQFFTYKDIDYVACWYKKAADYIQGTDIECAFVSTNSITQGEQTHALWMNMPVKINFAHTTFVWKSETKGAAAVYCVIIGFGCKSRNHKYIYTNGKPTECDNINGYLKDRPDVYVPPRTKPLCDVPEMDNGNVPLDGDALKIESDELGDFNNCMHLIKKLIGGREVLYNKMRYALWLVDTPISEVKKYPKVLARVEQCRLNRLAMKDKSSQKHAEHPMTFRDTKNPDNFIAIPSVSGERREYIPMAFFRGDTVTTNQVQTIPDATVYHLGVLTSSTHMAWMRETCGRLKSDYRYSKEIVYNSFPWPEASEQDKECITALMQDILDIRSDQESKGDCLADMYDPRYMPPVLRKAHKNLDCAVLKLYGLKPDAEESDIVKHLLELYKKLVCALNIMG